MSDQADNVSLALLDKLNEKAGKKVEQLKSGDGGGTFDDMEPRVARLEGQFEKLTDKVDSVRLDLAVLNERVSHLPSKGFIVSATVAALALFSAIILFQDRLATLIGG